MYALNVEISLMNQKEHEKNTDLTMVHLKNLPLVQNVVVPTPKPTYVPVAMNISQTDMLKQQMNKDGVWIVIALWSLETKINTTE